MVTDTRNTELDDLRELRQLVEDWESAIDPPREKMVGSMANYVVVKDAVLRKLRDIRVKWPKAIQRSQRL